MAKADRFLIQHGNNQFMKEHAVFSKWTIRGSKDPSNPSYQAYCIKVIEDWFTDNPAEARLFTSKGSATNSMSRAAKEFDLSVIPVRITLEMI